MDSQGFPINSFYAMSPLPYSFHHDQHRSVHCSTFWTHSKQLEDSLKNEREAHDLHAKAIKDMAKGNNVEALTMEQARARLKRSKAAEEKNGLIVTSVFSAVPTGQGIKTWIAIPEIKSKIALNSGDFVVLYFQLKWKVMAALPDSDLQSVARTESGHALIMNFCIWDIGADIVPAKPLPEKTKNLPVYRTNYQLFPDKEKNAKRKAARKKANNARGESEHASTSTSASTSMPADWKDELD